jgi:hypothetical protein
MLPTTIQTNPSEMYRNVPLSPKIGVRVTDTERALEEFRAVERAFEKSPYVIPPEIMGERGNSTEGENVVMEDTEERETAVVENADDAKMESEDIFAQVEDMCEDDLDLSAILDDYSTSDMPSSPFLQDTSPKIDDSTIPPLALLGRPEVENTTTITRMPSIQRRGQEILREYLLKRSLSPPTQSTNPAPVPPKTESSPPQAEPSRIEQINTITQHPSILSPKHRTISYSIPLTTIILIVILTLSLIGNLVQHIRLREFHLSQQKLWDEVMTPTTVGETFEIFTQPASRWSYPWNNKKTPEGLRRVSPSGLEVTVQRGLSFGRRGKRGRLEEIEKMLKSKIAGMVTRSKVFLNEIWRRFEK